MQTDLTIVTQFFPPDFAATGQLIQELASGLAELGYKVQVYTGLPGYAFSQADAPRYEKEDDVQIHRTRASQVLSKRIRWKVINGILFWLRVLIKLRHRQIRGSHLLFTSAPPFLFILGWFYNCLFDQSYSCLIYDIYPEVAVRLGVVKPNHWTVKLWELANRLSWERAHSIIVLNEPMKQFLSSQNPRLSHKIHVIPTWANPDQIHPIPKSDNWFSRKQGLDPFFTVLYSGNLGRCHDEETLIEAAQLLEGHPQIRFVFIGEGVGSERIQNEITAGHLTNVIRLPYQERETLAYSLSAADISLVSLKPGLDSVVAPSKFYGILASGRPVLAVCAPDCYLRSLLDQGQCGYAVDNGDAHRLVAYIQELAQDNSRRSLLGQNARRYFEQNFTLDLALPKFQNALLSRLQDPIPAISKRLLYPSQH